MSRRNPKTDGMVREAIAAIIEQDIADPRLRMVSITDVQVTQDHDHATVWYSVMDPDVVTGRQDRGERLPTVSEVGEGLESAASRIRGLLGKRVRLRRTPALKFVHDPVQQTATRVEELLRGLHDGER